MPPPFRHWPSNNSNTLRWFNKSTVVEVMAVPLYATHLAVVAQLTLPLTHSRFTRPHMRLLVIELPCAQLDLADTLFPHVPEDGFARLIVRIHADGLA